MRMYLLTALLLALPASASAQDDSTDDVRDARCILVKSTILGLVMNEPEADPAIAAGITSHVTYFYGRLSRTMSDQAISDLVVREAQKTDMRTDLQALESECDAHMQSSIGGMIALGERLSAMGR